MSTLDRRLTALEKIAGDVHRRQMRDLIRSWPEAHDLTPAELDEATDEAVRYLEELRCVR